MNPNFERAVLLFGQSRHELAENELRQGLSVEPDDAHAHALLALCLAHREKFQEATDEAKQAVHLEPDNPFTYYALAYVLHDRHRPDEALPAIQEAIRLDPGDADYLALLSQIYLDERQWPGALEAAERGQQYDPEHVGCTNLRAIALVKLGRKSEAGATIDAALARTPENSLTHANQGWTLLERTTCRGGCGAIAESRGGVAQFFCDRRGRLRVAGQYSDHVPRQAMIRLRSIAPEHPPQKQKPG
jgi:tetratricopeptide (TPR) repeat protein